MDKHRTKPNQPMYQHLTICKVLIKTTLNRKKLPISPKQRFDHKF